MADCGWRAVLGVGCGGGWCLCWDLSVVCAVDV